MTPALLDTSKLIVGASGSGKTVTAKDEVGQLLEQARHVAIIDPTGVWWGMRAGPKDVAGGFTLPIFGGAHGDIAIRPDMGAAIARILLGQNVSGIIDLSAIDNSRDWRVFMADFVAELRRGVTGNFHLVVDEADEFAAERAVDDVGFALRENLVWIAKRGRAQGFVPTWITQRTAEIAKAVISQAQTIIAHQLVAPSDRKAIDDYLKGNGSADARKAVMESLAELQVGERWIYSPRLKLLERGLTPALTTFDSSRTPAPGETIAAPRTLAELDVSAIAAALQAPVEPHPDDRIPANPRDAYDRGSEVGAALAEREGRIADLEAANALLTETAAAVASQRDSARLRLGAVGVAIDAALNHLQMARRKIDRELQELDANMHSGDADMHAEAPTADEASPPAAGAPGQAAVPPRPPRAKADEADDTLNAAAIAIASLLKGAPRRRAAWSDLLVMAGFRPGSGWIRKSAKQLLAHGLLVERGDVVEGTPALVEADIARTPAPSADAIRQLWREKLRGPGGQIATSLAVDGPATRLQVAQRLNMSATAGWFRKGIKDVLGSRLATEDGDLLRPNLLLVGEGKKR